MSTFYTHGDQRGGIVMDPIHGAISLRGYERPLIDHPLVQRLRFIQQNDVTHLVFPCATHTRFAHSLGVMHIASQCFDVIAMMALEQRRDLKASAKQEVENAVAYFGAVVRVAALLHDIGHGPFSHAFERSAAVADLYNRKAVFERLWQGLAWQTFIKQRPLGFSHTMYSVRLAHDVLGDVQRSAQAARTPHLPFAAQDVLALLEGSAVTASPTFADHASRILRAFKIRALPGDQAAGAVTTILRSIIFGTVNADTLDWVLRDSYFSGSLYGVFNLDHLVSSLRLGYSLDRHGRLTWAGLAIAEKGLGDLEQFAFARLQLYRRVYGHPAIVGFKVLLAHALEETLQDPMTRRHTANALSEPAHLSTLHDYSVWSQFIEYASQDHDSASYDLIGRRKLEFLELLEDPSDAAVVEATTNHATTTSRRIVSSETVLRTRLTGQDADAIRVLVTEDGKARLRDLAAQTDFEGRRYDVRMVHLFAIKSGWAHERELARSQGPGLLICGAGLPSAGKSSVLRHFAGRIGARFFREPEELRWPEAVIRREAMGYYTALSWFRSVRVQNLINAAEARDQGDIAVVDSYYDKMISLYLGKPAVQWLLPSTDQYFSAFRQVAAVDYELLPDADLVVIFKVSESDWRRFLTTRGRELDGDSEFLQSYASQEYFLEAGKTLARERGIECYVFERQFLETATPTEDAADQLLMQLQPWLESRGFEITSR